MSEDILRLTSFSKGGGCGCKIAPSVLQQILGSRAGSDFERLLVGNESADDAAVYKLDETTAVISTTDFFLPIVDDPFDFGRIAAANAISDVYAMGGQPLMAIAILGFPIDKLPIETAQQILAGGRAICAEANIPLAGGHTVDTAEPIFGLAVTGTAPIKNIKKNNAVQEGDVLFLTKPIGTGIVATALKKGLLQQEHYAPLIQNMTSLNKIGAALGRIEGVHAMTDVTGFGLLGHALEMAEGSNLSLELYYGQLQQLPGLSDYLKQRAIPDATYRNWNSYSQKVKFEKGVNVMEAFSVLPDPQTNGGLLIAVAPDAVADVKKVLGDHHSAPVGRCVAKGEKWINVLP